MRRLFWFLSFLAFSTINYGQISFDGFYHREDQNGPEIFADGILSFFAASDNQLKLGNTEQAIIILDAAIAQNPYFVESYIKRARLYQLIGRTQSAKKDINTALKLNPGIPMNLNARSFKYETGHLTDTSLQYNFINQIDLPSHQYQLIQDAIRLKLKGQSSDALFLIDQLIQETPQKRAYKFNLRGNIHLLLQNHYLAVEDYSKAISITPDEPLYYFNRGLAQLQSTNRNAACEDLKKSEQLGFDLSTEKLVLYCYH